VRRRWRKFTIVSTYPYTDRTQSKL
jgi:hypothetical protein